MSKQTSQKGEKLNVWNEETQNYYNSLTFAQKFLVLCIDGLSDEQVESLTAFIKSIRNGAMYNHG